MALKLVDLANKITESATAFLITNKIKLERMTKGNTKLAGALTFSLPPIKSCLNCSSCKHTCYARKAYKAYPSCKNAWDLNFELAKNHLDLLETLLTAQIQEEYDKRPAQNPLVVRIHVSGDFFSQEYLDMWARIADRFPMVYFWGYTKVRDMFSFVRVPWNMNIINSFIAGDMLNYGPEEYVDQLCEQYGAFKCPATTNGPILCMRDCKYCLTGTSPVFVQH